jgi:hypothetical protein
VLPSLQVIRMPLYCGNKACRDLHGEKEKNAKLLSSIPAKRTRLFCQQPKAIPHARLSKVTSFVKRLLVCHEPVLF